MPEQNQPVSDAHQEPEEPAEQGHEAGSGWLHTLSSASSFCNAAFSAFTDSNSDFKCSTSSALEAFRYCLMKLWQRNGRR